MRGEARGLGEQAVHGPREVHRGGARRGEDGAGSAHRREERGGVLGVGGARGERHSIGCGDADRRGAADDHGADRLGHRGRARERDVDLALGAARVDRGGRRDRPRPRARRRSSAPRRSPREGARARRRSRGAVPVGAARPRASAPDLLGHGGEVLGGLGLLAGEVAAQRRGRDQREIGVDPSAPRARPRCRRS